MAKYRLAHPTVSVHVDKAFYVELQELKARTGKSVGDVLREALGKQKASSGDAHQTGFVEGYEQGYGDALKDFPLGRCARCRELLRWDLSDKKHLAILTERITDVRHAHCPDGPGLRLAERAERRAQADV